MNNRLKAVNPGLADEVRELLQLAPRGLAAAHLPRTDEFAQTVRAVSAIGGITLQQEGTNLRYAAIAALGLSRLPLDEQRAALSGSTASAVAVTTALRAARSEDPGAVALAAWGQAEINGVFPEHLVWRLNRLLDSEQPVATVDASWLVTAAVAAGELGGEEQRSTEQLLARGVALLLPERGRHGTYPHQLPAHSQPRWRAHVGSFADQIYPIQALSRAYVATGTRSWLHAANEVARNLCARQGPLGQWWWHYDTRTGSVVEPYPVYSVHQHAMAPMALFELAEAGGDRRIDAIERGVTWLARHPEVLEEVVAGRHGLIWRKVGRREPPKAARALGAVTTAVRPGLHVPTLDRLLPAGVVDHECRPYELGWLLYAWGPR